MLAKMQSWTEIETPVGALLAIAEDGALTHLLFSDGDDAAAMRANGLKDEVDDPIFDVLREQLANYFAGERESFDLELQPSGTPFQERVWQELRNIPFGETISYGELARRIDNPGAMRAVGGANNRNPLSIVIPCHRVIGSARSLVGYGGGLDRKRALLELEHAEVANKNQLELRL